MLKVLLKVPGMHDLVEALASYTQRHFVRMDRLVRSSFLLDYTLASMNVVMPEAGPDDVVAANELDELEGTGTDMDESTGTDVDTDAFMQPATDIQADAHVQAVGPEQRHTEQVEPGVLEQQEQLQERPAEVQDDKQQEAQHGVSHAANAQSSKRRKSAPSVGYSPAATHAGPQTAVKAKRKKTK